MKKTTRNSIIGFVILLGLIAIYFFSPLRDYLSVEKISQLSEKVPQTPTSFASLLGAYAVAGALLVPMPLMAFASSLIFPTWIAVGLCILGAAIASSSAYFIGRFIDLDIFGNKVKKHLDRVKKRLDGKGAYAVLALRVAPTPPFTITSLLAGSLKFSFPKYLIASTVGILPLMLLVLFFGKEMLESLKSPSVMSITSLVAIAILFIIFKMVKKKVNSNEEGEKN
jgi:uncharacterized membrane protein YdjX (TVP38/TMEM64 family)